MLGRGGGLVLRLSAGMCNDASCAYETLALGGTGWCVQAGAWDSLSCRRALAHCLHALHAAGPVLGRSPTSISLPRACCTPARPHQYMCRCTAPWRLARLPCVQWCAPRSGAPVSFGVMAHSAYSVQGHRLLGRGTWLRELPPLC
eukprot:3238811-Alexandrium_andersonii.AAC.1